jgi:sialic acid synthase SpsE
VGYSRSSAFSFNIGFFSWVFSKCSIYSISEVKCRKNFIRENVRQLREMQGYRRNEEEYDTVTGRRSTANRYENMPARTPHCYVSSGIAKI